MAIGTVEADVREATANNIPWIASAIALGYIAVIPYGRKERRLFALVGSIHSQNVIDRMLEIKQRSASQALAISGIPEAVPMVAELGKTPALVTAARRLDMNPQTIIEACFRIGAIGLVLSAQDWLPKEVTRERNGQKTVLIAGEDTSEEYDIFPKVYRHLIDNFGLVMAGTSANLHGEDTYHVLQQDEALVKLRPHVDLFVYDQVKIGFLPLMRHFTSTTIIDLTQDHAAVLRWGSLHPNRFKELFPDLQFNPGDLGKPRGRERLHHLFLKRLFPKGILES